VEFDGFGEASDAAQFDIDDASGTEAESLLGMVGGANALVKTDGVSSFGWSCAWSMMSS